MMTTLLGFSMRARGHYVHQLMRHIHPDLEASALVDHYAYGAVQNVLASYALDEQVFHQETPYQGIILPIQQVANSAQPDVLAPDEVHYEH